jgi:hypothetical protein
MAYIDGTRTSTLTMSHTQDVQIRIWNPFAVIPPDQDWQYKATNFTFSGHLGFSASLTIATNVVAPSPGAAWTWQLRANITVNNGHGSTNTSYTVLASGSETGATTYRDVSATCAGDFSASVSTDKLWDITQTAYSSTSAPTVFPPNTSYRWYEMTTSGAIAACSLSAGGSTVSVSAAASSRQTANYTATLSADGASIGPSTHDFAVSLVKVNGVAVHNITHAHTWYNQSATEWTMHLEGGVDAFGVYTGADGTISTSSCLDRNVSVIGRTRAWSASYPDSLSVVVTGFDGSSRTISGTGSMSGSDTFVDYSTTTVLVDPDNGSNTLTTSLDDVPASISCAITSASLTAVGEASTETRCMFRGFRFNGWSLAYATTRSIAGTGNDRLFAPWEGMSGYRYLDIQIKAQSGTNVAGTFEITDFHGNTKTWNITAATTSYAVVTIDLCSPDSWSVSALPLTDGKDNPYPRKNTASASYAGSESVDSAYWGVTSCQRLRIATGAIDLGTTTLKQDTTNGFTNSHYVPSGLGYEHERITPAIVAEAGTTTYYYSRRFWQQKNDGRDEEESDYWWQKTVGGATGVTTYSVTPLSISDLAGQVNASDDSIVRHPGWTATNSVAYPGSGTCSVSQPPLRNCFLNGGTGISTWLYGGGILATPNATSGTDFAYGFEIAAGSVTAQTLFDSINGDFIPDLFDPFDVNGGTDSALYLPFGAILRGPAHGIVFDNAGDPATTGTVTLQLSSDSSSRGTDSTFDAIGNYQTGSPFGLGKANHSIVIGASSVGVNPMYSAKRQRAVFREETLAGNCTAADVSPAQQATYGVVTASGGVKLYHSRAHNGTNWDEVTTPITNAECLSLAYQKHSGAMTLIIIVDTTSGEVKRYTTDDEGNTVSVATTIGTGAHGTVCVSPNGMEYIFFRTSSSNIQRVKRDPMGNVITAASNVVTGNVSDDEIACYWRLGVVYLIYTHTTNGITIVSSSDDAETFS